MTELRGKVALVTGAGHRVGRGIALALAGAGCHVIVHYHASAAEAGQTAADIRALGVDSLAVQADQADPAQVERLFAAAAARFGRVDVLVNSAAVMERVEFLDVSVEQWDRAMNVNLRGPFLCSQRAARLMQAAGGGAIVNIADVAGLRPWAHYAPLSVSKAGVIMLTQVMARALAPAIRVNAVVPGPVVKPQGWDDARWQAVWDKLPLQREGSAAEVAQAVLYLARAEFTTGAILSVDGGALLV